MLPNIQEFLATLQDFTSSLPDVLQWLGVFLIAAIPFVESYFGSAIGVLAGVPPVIAVAAAVIGNLLSMLIFVLTAHGVRTRATQGREAKPLTPRRAKLKERFDRYGVPGVSLLGQLFLPSQITSAAMVSFGASKNQVIFWQVISIILWGVLFGVLATLGISALGFEAAPQG
ncbi:small multi-drug export protein [Leucobacter sp. M11]|uniref:small multi-drug export protein n=1 Tax=Leucobacter sp. M11 TaxID=2993565 RepID=UPI002D7FAD12|nr:small multi-drug export protein [Leucobacter sp. M11]MEB4616379.1 small multi-drug export protein [Leucobacter sp. M11]